MTSGSDNVAIGKTALKVATTGIRNSAHGNQTLYSLTTGDDNVAMGNSAGYNLTTADDVVAIGRVAAYALTTGDGNTCIGKSAGYSITTGEDNVCIGRNAGEGQVATSCCELWIARADTGAGNAATWIHGNSSGALYAGNNSSSLSTTSDRRLKKNIVDSPKGLTEIDQLRVTNFEYRKEDEIDMSEFTSADGPHQICLNDKTKEGVVQTGVIAQEVESVLPECINISKKGVKTVNTDPILWALVNAVKELSAKVTALEGN